MKLTKYGHACVALEEQGKKLIIDPGIFTPEFGDIENIVAVVVTHVHTDHFNPPHLEAIFAANPDAKLFTTQEVSDAFKRPDTTVVAAGQEISVGPFSMRFGGEMHALIHQTLPCPQNTSVFVNDTFFYPGDSYTMPDKPVTILAVPGNAPWMKVGDSMDYIAKVKPKICFPTHNGLLSENGHKVYNGALESAAKANNVGFKYIQSGESVEF